MSLEGLRAWIGEVERKLGMRTRVFLALAVIAIGLGGAAIYLAIDTRENSVSESDVQALQERLETRIDEVGTAVPTPPAEEIEPVEPEPEPAPEPKPKSGKGGGGNGNQSSAGAGSAPSSATGGAASSAKLQELLEEAKKKSGEAEAGQNGK
jgi:hypothetical protein